MKKLMALLVLCVGLAACAPSSEVVSVTRPVATAQPTAVATKDMPTQTPSDVVPTSVAAVTTPAQVSEMVDTAFAGIRFEYDGRLGSELASEFVTAVTPFEAGENIDNIIPDHIVFTFTDSYASNWSLTRQTTNVPYQPSIFVYPTAPWAETSEFVAAELAGLARMLGERPSPPVGLPFLPLGNGRPQIAAQLAYLDFANGRGVRYVSQINSDSIAINNAELLYVFQGLTDDNAYVVTAFFPLRTVSLPQQSSATVTGGQHRQTERQLNALTTSAFTPDLALLDAVVQSLLVQPNVPLTSGDLMPPPSPEDLAPIVEDITLSPDGLWQATMIRFDEITRGNDRYFYLTLTVQSVNDDVVWQPVAEWRGAGLGEAWVSPTYWSKDGRFLYYSDNASPDGCALFYGTSDLYRLDLMDGSVAELIPQYSTSSIAIAPDERYVAYPHVDGVALQDIEIGYDNNGNVINAPNVESIRTVRLPLQPGDQYGALVWSQHSQRLLVTVAHEPCGQNWTHSIYLIENDVATPLIEKDDRQFVSAGWVGLETAVLQDKDGQTWHYDIVTGELTKQE